MMLIIPGAGFFLLFLGATYLLRPLLSGGGAEELFEDVTLRSILISYWPAGLIILGMGGYIIRGFRLGLWPLLLMVAGVAALAFIAWESLWPVGVIILGLFILVKWWARRRRATQDSRTPAGPG